MGEANLQDVLVQRLFAAGLVLASVKGRCDPSVAARLEPANADAHESLGLLCAQHGKLEEAVHQFQEQLRLRPDAQARYNLGLALAQQAQHMSQ